MLVDSEAKTGGSILGVLVIVYDDRYCGMSVNDDRYCGMSGKHQNCETSRDSHCYRTAL
jgi:hypothetical protein